MEGHAPSWQEGVMGTARDANHPRQGLTPPGYLCSVPIGTKNPATPKG